MSQPEITILILVYNAEEYLHDCLDSVSKQSFPNFELICIDDGSTDSCPEILDSYVKQDSRIKVIHQDNIGQYPSRNVAFNYINGRYVIFIDCDDIVDKYLLEKCYYRAEAESADITLLGWDYINNVFESPDLSTWTLNNWNKQFIGNFPLGFGYIWMKLYRTEFIKHSGIKFNENFYSKSDVIFHWQTMAVAKKICVVREPLYHYRVHNKSVTGTIGPRFVDVIYVMETIKSELIALGDPKQTLKLWSTYALPFIYSAYKQLSPEYRPIMRQKVGEFLNRLDANDKATLVNSKLLPKDVRYFYLSLGSSLAYIRYFWLYQISQHIKRKIKNIFLPIPFRTRLLIFLRKRSYRLSNTVTQYQKLTVDELNTEVDMLARKVYELKQQLHNQNKT